MSENKTETQVVAPAAAPAEPVKPTLAAGLFKPYTLGSTLQAGPTGNQMSNLKASPMDYEKKYQGSTKNQPISAEDLAKLSVPAPEVKKSKFKEVSSAIQRKEGVSKESADAIAAAAGRKELGEKEMERRSKEARKSMTEVLAAVPAEEREVVLAELERRRDEAKKSNNEVEAERLGQAKESAKKAWESKA